MIKKYLGLALILSFTVGLVTVSAGGSKNESKKKFSSAQAQTALSPSPVGGSLAAHSDVPLDVKDEIYRLSIQIRDALPYSRSTPQELEDARQMLADAYRLVYEGALNPGEEYRQCVDYAYRKYYLGLPSSVAMDRASSVCKNVGDLESLKFLFDAHYRSLPAVTAMDRAAAEATRNLRNKQPILSFAFDAYYRQLPATQAASRAASGTAAAPRDSLECLKTAFSRHYQNLPAASAMDQAFLNCRYF